ncbi:unnamed protein product [Symbiodinium necroappetens]|uniref:EF-hand domain-containing protein n=1 Tax=Symbiodinium necroappetens TaxID=1628268 RepID=A0A812TZ89_9DINO|nr:unnamed protein product [Symbiodinium necroappetens]
MFTRMLRSAAVCLWLPLPVLAAPVEIEIDPADSELEVILLLLGVGDSDTSPLAGTVVIDLDGTPPTGQLTILDVHLRATEKIEHSLTFGLPGVLTQSTDGLEINAAEPGMPSAPAVFDGAMFDILHLDVELAGTGSHDASGLVCTVLQGEGINCEGTTNLAALGDVVVPDIRGVLAVEGEEVTVTLFFDVEVPYEGLGSLVLSGRAAGVGTLPDLKCAGDCDGSGEVDFNDLVAMLFEFGPGQDAACDPDATGEVDFNDLVSALFLFGPCS